MEIDWRRPTGCERERREKGEEKREREGEITSPVRMTWILLAAGIARERASERKRNADWPHSLFLSRSSRQPLASYASYMRARGQISEWPVIHT